MKNPWEDIPLSSYEAHMQQPDILQDQKLNAIMREQFDRYQARSAVIFGISGGNGLEHIDPGKWDKIYGLDINTDFLAVCASRYPELAGCLELGRTDLSDVVTELPRANLLVANMVIEYIGIETFLVQLKKVCPRFLTCVIQKNEAIGFVSASPYTATFDGISALHRDIDQNELISSIRDFRFAGKREYLLPQRKKFIRLDFEK